MNGTQPGRLLYTDPETGRRFTLVRPSIGGLEEMAHALTATLTARTPGASAADLLEMLVGGLLRSRVLLAAYLRTVDPREENGDLGPWVPKPSGWSFAHFEFEHQAEFIRVAEEAEKFHGTFRELDRHFGALAGPPPSGEAGMGDHEEPSGVAPPG